MILKNINLTTLDGTQTAVVDVDVNYPGRRSFADGDIYPARGESLPIWILETGNEALLPFQERQLRILINSSNRQPMPRGRHPESATFISNGFHDA